MLKSYTLWIKAAIIFQLLTGLIHLLFFLNNLHPASFSLLCLFGGTMNWHLVRKKIDPEVLKGTIVINLIIFGVCFVIMAFRYPLPPKIFSGLIFFSLILALVTFPGKQEQIGS